MTVFIPSEKKIPGNLRTISVMAGDDERPVMSVIAARGKNPFDTDKITANILNVLNGGRPLETLRCQGLRMGWIREDRSVGFHVQRNENLGSKDSLSFVFTQDCPEEIVNEIKEKLTDSDNIKALCDVVSVERFMPSHDIKPGISRNL